MQLREAPLANAMPVHLFVEPGQNFFDISVKC